MAKMRRMTQEEDIPYHLRYGSKKGKKKSENTKTESKNKAKVAVAKTSDSKKKNIVYLLGAGCSASFGYPVTSQIMPGICEHIFAAGQLEDYKLQLTDSLSKIYSCFVPPYDKENLVDIIELLSLVDYSCLYNLPPHPDMDIKSTDSLKENLLRALVEMLTEYDLKKKDKEARLSYKAFQKVLKDQINSHNVSIITTNYDMSIDLALSEDGLEIDYGIEYRNFDSEVISRPRDAGVKYFKLHGSHNWLKCNCCGMYYINSKGNISQRFFDNELNYNNTCICSDHARLQLVLVAPSLVRDVRDPNLLQIWNLAQESLRTADELIFIGYSLPSEDIAIKSLLLRGINTNPRGSSRVVKTSVVLRGDSRKKAYYNLLNKKTMDFYAGGLEEWMKKAMKIK